MVHVQEWLLLICKVRLEELASAGWLGIPGACLKFHWWLVHAEVDNVKATPSELVRLSTSLQTASERSLEACKHTCKLYAR